MLETHLVGGTIGTGLRLGLGASGGTRWQEEEDDDGEVSASEDREVRG
jgi:hypothetical protein